MILFPTGLLSAQLVLADDGAALALLSAVRILGSKRRWLEFSREET